MEKDFKKWFDDFIKKYGDYHPKDIDAWVNLIDSNHKKIREILGGVQKTFEVKVEQALRPLDIYSVRPIMQKVINILPKYYADYNNTINEASFCREKLTICNKVAGSKHIMTYAKRQKLSEDKLNEINKLVASLGQLHQKNKANPNQNFMTVSTDPKAFCLIGKYAGEGNYSCFAQGANFNGDKKYAWGAHPNSFVVMPHRTKDINLNAITAEGTEGRGLGVLDDNGAIYITNMMPQYHACMSPAAFEKVFGELLNWGKPSTAQNLGTLTGGICYGKPNGTKFPYIVYDKSKLKQGDIDKKISPPTQYSKEYKPNGDNYALWD